MPQVFRRPLAIAVLVIGALLGYALLPRDQARIPSLLGDLCAELNQVRDEASLGSLEAVLPNQVEPQIIIRAPELDPGLEGLRAVLDRAPELLSVAPLSFALSDLDVHVSGALARVEADLNVTVRGSAEQRRELRRTHIRLAKVGSVWRVEAVEIDAALPQVPEARP
jgi:hypothetical protein